MGNRGSLMFGCIGLAVVMFASSCATTPKRKRQKVVVMDFDGDAGEIVRNAVESRLSRLRQYFRVLARDNSTMRVLKREMIQSKNRDDMWRSKKGAPKLGRHLNGAIVIHGSCFKKENEQQKSTAGGFLVYKGMKETFYEIYCSYRVVDIQSTEQLISGDSTKSWYEEKPGLPPSPEVIKEISHEIAEDIQEQMEEIHAH